MGFFHFQVFFQKSGSVTIVPLWCPNFMQKIRINDEQSLRYLKRYRPRTDGRTTDGRTTGGRTTYGDGWLHRTLSDKTGSKNKNYNFSSSLPEFLEMWHGIHTALSDILDVVQYLTHTIVLQLTIAIHFRMVLLLTVQLILQLFDVLVCLKREYSMIM